MSNTVVSTQGVISTLIGSYAISWVSGWSYWKTVLGAAVSGEVLYLAGFDNSFAIFKGEDDQPAQTSTRQRTKNNNKPSFGIK